ncbi:MAG: type II toxin-antitoxin system RelE/ParE family toxin [Candidatus Nanohaloarchaea archaeon]|nr:type II toxin-antitoxin system RelE/ParE family toxin [Candidatus Nanohaloarchaea archaeon]
MSYSIEIQPTAKKQLKKLETHRLRVGDYRVFADLEKDKSLIRVLAIRHREEAYDRSV